MNGSRYIDVEGLRRYLRRIRSLDGDLAEKVVAWAEKQPEMPDLLSVTGAARRLGVGKGYVIKLRAAGRLASVPVEGGAGVFLREDVEAVGREIDATRARRGMTKAVA